MRRTTICRSRNPALVAGVAALLLCPALGAQEGAAGAGGQVPATHEVVPGETLWAIAQMYYGDPLLWPEVYRLNTAVVEDPHWIYPGEVLALAPLAGLAPGDTVGIVAQREPADTVRAELGDTVVMDTLFAPEPPPDAPESAETIFDRRPSAQQRVQRTLEAYLNQPYRPVRRGEFYSAGFLTENEALPWARVIGGTATPSIASLEARGVAQLYGEVALLPARNASYHVGDSLLVVRLDRSVPEWGEVAVPIGIVRVTQIQPQQVLGQLIAQFGALRLEDVAIPLEPFRDPGEVRPVPVTQGLEGRVIDARDPQPLTGTQDFVFIDKGRRDGVMPGDIFEAYRPEMTEPGSASSEVVVTLLVVHTRERSATGLVIGVNRGDLDPGTPIRLIRKMPS
jgi:hypothetical protein